MPKLIFFCLLFIGCFNILFYPIDVFAASFTGCTITVSPESGDVGTTPFQISGNINVKLGGSVKGGLIKNQKINNNWPKPIFEWQIAIKDNTKIDYSTAFFNIKDPGSYVIGIYDYAGTAVPVCVSSPFILEASTSSPPVGDCNPVTCNSNGSQDSSKWTCNDNRCKTEVASSRAGVDCKCVLQTTANTSSTCNTSITINEMSFCGSKDDFEYLGASRCGADNKGFDCKVPGTQLCLEGEKKEEKVVCQKKKPAPRLEGTGKQCSFGGATNNGIETALGCVPTDPTAFIMAVSRLATAAGGGIALLLIIAGAFRMITSAGNPDAVKAGSEQITSAIIGLLFIIFAVLLLQVIGVQILDLPGFGGH